MRTTTRSASSLLVAALLAGGAPAMAQEVHRLAPEQLSSEWVLLNRDVSVDVPNSGVNIYKPGCVAVTYTIGSDGVPMNVQVAKMAPQSDLGKAAVSAVSNFRYGPSLGNKNHMPVATYYVVPFNAPDDPAQRAQLMAPCKLPGYTCGAFGRQIQKLGAVPGVQAGITHEHRAPPGKPRCPPRPARRRP